MYNKSQCQFVCVNRTARCSTPEGTRRNRRQRLWLLSGHAQGSHSGIKAGAFHAQDLGCTARARNPAARSVEHFADVPSLCFLQGWGIGKGVIFFSLHFCREFRDSNLGEPDGRSI
jgi:hypothetical protein